MKGFVGACAAVVCSVFCVVRAPAQSCAWTPVPFQIPVFCTGTDGCTGSTTRYGCRGYGTVTTPAHPAGPIVCCGFNMGYGLVNCASTCAGCVRDRDGLSRVASARQANDESAGKPTAVESKRSPRAANPLSTGATPGTAPGGGGR